MVSPKWLVDILHFLFWSIDDSMPTQPSGETSTKEGNPNNYDDDESTTVSSNLLNMNHGPETRQNLEYLSKRRQEKFAGIAIYVSAIIGHFSHRLGGISVTSIKFLKRNSSLCPTLPCLNPIEIPGNQYVSTCGLHRHIELDKFRKGFLLWICVSRPALLVVKELEFCHMIANLSIAAAEIIPKSSNMTRFW